MADFDLGSRWGYFRSEAEAHAWLSFYDTGLEEYAMHDLHPRIHREWVRWRDLCASEQSARLLKRT